MGGNIDARGAEVVVTPTCSKAWLSERWSTATATTTMTAMTNKADTPSVRVLLRGVIFGDDTLLARSNRLDGVQFAP